MVNAKKDMYYWAGRWVLISGDSVFMDSCGTLGIFYIISDDGEIIFSSSPHLLCMHQQKYKWIQNYDVTLFDFGWINFYPGPFTPIENVLSLLCSQYIDLNKMKVCNRQDFDFNRFHNWDCEEVISEIVEAEVKVLKEISKEYDDKVFLPLTAGVDSRTILAIAVKANIPVTAYTVFRRKLAEMLDYFVPWKLCDILNVNYFMFDEYGDKSDDVSKRMMEVDTHCGGHLTNGNDVNQYLSGLDVENTKSVVLWGTIWEVGTHFYRLAGRLPEVEYSDDVDEILNAINDECYRCIDKSIVHAKSLRQWLKHVLDNPIDGLTWLDRLYWEQRVGQWLKNQFLLYDMFDAERIAPINCQYLLELLVSIQAKDKYARINKIFQKKIIKKTCPSIYGVVFSKCYYAISEDVCKACYGRSVVIYGLGHMYEVYAESGSFEDFKIVALCDKKDKMVKQNYPVVRPDELKKMAFDFIIVTSRKYYEEIKCDLVKKYGVPLKKIRCC